MNFWEDEPTDDEVLAVYSYEQEGEPRVLFPHSGTFRRVEEPDGVPAPSSGKMFHGNPALSDYTRAADTARIKEPSNPSQSSTISDSDNTYKSVLDYGHLARQVEDYREHMPDYIQGEIDVFLDVLREAQKNVQGSKTDLEYINKVSKADSMLNKRLLPEDAMSSLDERVRWGEQISAASRHLKNPRLEHLHPSRSEWLIGRD